MRGRRLHDFLGLADPSKQEAASTELFAFQEVPRVASRPAVDDDLVDRFRRELEALGGEWLDGASSEGLVEVLSPWLVQLVEAHGGALRFALDPQLEIELPGVVECFRQAGCEVGGTSSSASGEVGGTSSGNAQTRVPRASDEVGGTSSSASGEVGGTSSGDAQTRVLMASDEVGGTSSSPSDEVGGTSSNHPPLAEIDLGVSLVDVGIAETGTLVETLRPGRERALSLLPPHHLAVMQRACLVADLEAFFDLIDGPPDSVDDPYASYFTWISGPSRTADIEKVLTIGVHGPGRLTVLCV